MTFDDFFYIRHSSEGRVVTKAIAFVRQLSPLAYDESGADGPVCVVSSGVDF